MVLACWSNADAFQSNIPRRIILSKGITTHRKFSVTPQELSGIVKSFVANEGDLRFTPIIDQNGEIICKANSQIRKGDEITSVPIGVCLDAAKARATIDQSVGSALSKFKLRTGDLGLISLLLLYEMSLGKSSKYDSYIRSLPDAAPGILSWQSNDLNDLYESSTRDFKTQIDAVEQDWKVLSSSPAISSFANEGKFRWALGIVKSRHMILDNKPALVPLIDYLSFDQNSSAEPFIAGAGVFGGKVIKVVADSNFDLGSTVTFSLGLKGSAECLEDHGFVPSIPLEDACCEFEVSLNPSVDKFYDDKFNILEAEAYGNSFRFDIEADSSASLDKELLRVLRLKFIEGQDAFILESVFSNTVFKTLSQPFSKSNEFRIHKFLSDSISTLLARLDSKSTSELDAKILVTSTKKDPKVEMSRLRMQERAALQGALSRIEASIRILQTADVNEYYQERRLRELDLLRPLEDDEIVQ